MPFSLQLATLRVPKDSVLRFNGTQVFTELCANTRSVGLVNDQLFSVFEQSELSVRCSVEK